VQHACSSASAPKLLKKLHQLAHPLLATRRQDAPSTAWYEARSAASVPGPAGARVAGASHAISRCRSSSHALPSAVAPSVTAPPFSLCSTARAVVTAAAASGPPSAATGSAVPSSSSCPGVSASNCSTTGDARAREQRLAARGRGTPGERRDGREPLQSGPRAVRHECEAVLGLQALNLGELGGAEQAGGVCALWLGE